jgi:hypothetical protein
VILLGCLTKWYNNVKPATTIRETIVADAGVYYASVDLADDVAVGVSRFKLNLFFPS